MPIDYSTLGDRLEAERQRQLQRRKPFGAGLGRQVFDMQTTQLPPIPNSSFTAFNPPPPSYGNFPQFEQSPQPPSPEALQFRQPVPPQSKPRRGWTLLGTEPGPDDPDWSFFGTDPATGQSTATPEGWGDVWRILSGNPRLSPAPVEATNPQYPQYLPSESAGSFGTGEGLFGGVPAIAPRPISEIAPPVPPLVGPIPRTSEPPDFLGDQWKAIASQYQSGMADNFGMREAPTREPNGRNPYDQNYMSYNNPIMQARRDAARQNVLNSPGRRSAQGSAYEVMEASRRRQGYPTGPAYHAQAGAVAPYAAGGPNYGQPLDPRATALLSPEGSMAQTWASLGPLQALSQLLGSHLQSQGVMGAAGMQSGAAALAQPPYGSQSGVEYGVGQRLGGTVQPQGPMEIWNALNQALANPNIDPAVKAQINQMMPGILGQLRPGGVGAVIPPSYVPPRQSRRAPTR